MNGKKLKKKEVQELLVKYNGKVDRSILNSVPLEIYGEEEIYRLSDDAGNYFRIENTNLIGKRRYLDLNGNIPNNTVMNGKISGRSQGEYNQVTHFNNID
ncbi:MAG TPA: hypothetical protein VIM65_02590 [Cyclobacteriaceae bacterium]